MNFSQFKYVRPNIDQMKEKLDQLLSEFNEANSVTAQTKIINEINKIRNTFESQLSICYIRHTCDTTNDFYEQENDYFDEVMPFYESLVTKYYQNLISSKYKNELTKKFGEHLFNIAELKLKTFSDDVIEKLQEENRLVSRYIKLKASAKIEFDNKVLNLSQMKLYLESIDRNTRKEAAKKVSTFYQNHQNDFDEIYHKLVLVRTQIAEQLGFKNFIELGYARLLRTDYNPVMVANYRKQVEEIIVPLCTDLIKRQANRINIVNLKHYDEELKYLTGNPVPKGNSKDILNNGKILYTELSKETAKFFKYMTDNELLDLEAKPGKAGGGYCTYIPDHQAPFIFSNFNGTSGDVDVLTHEAGHAFQVYCSRNIDVPEYVWATYETSEIHSMSMEFFAWPWMTIFFEEDESKYKYTHLSSAVLFIPYGVAVDEFQHFVYENPSITPEQRKKAWRDIEHKYLPHRDYDDDEFLNSGGFWYRQGHIFETPFYYIDYTLAQVSALQFFTKDQQNHENAWHKYVNLCNAGGTQSFINLLEIAELDNPFKDNIIKKIISPINDWLDNFNDTNL